MQTIKTIKFCGVTMITESDFDRALLNLLVLDGIIEQTNDATYCLALTNQASTLIDHLARLRLHANVIADHVRVGSPSDGIAVLRSLLSVSLLFAERLVSENLLKRSGQTCLTLGPAATERQNRESGAEEVRAASAKNLDSMIADEKLTVKPKMKTPKIPRTVKYTYSKSDMELAVKWAQFARAKAPWIPASDEKFAHCINSIRRTTTLTSDGIASVFEFVKKDSFWSDQAISPSGLSKKSSRNGLRKIDNILRQMKAREVKTNVVAKAEEKLVYEDDQLAEWNPFDEL